MLGVSEKAVWHTKLRQFRWTDNGVSQQSRPAHILDDGKTNVKQILICGNQTSPGIKKQPHIFCCLPKYHTQMKTETSKFQKISLVGGIDVRKWSGCD